MRKLKSFTNNIIGPYGINLNVKSGASLTTDNPATDKFTYVKTGICNIQGSNIPKDYLNQIRAIFNNGLTFWNMETENNFVGNYITNNNLL